MNGLLRLVLAGPLVVLILLIALALVLLVAAFLRKADTLTAFGERVLLCLEERRIVTPLWGIAAAALCLVASFALFSKHASVLLGIVVLAAGLGLSGFGLCVAAVHLGRIWARALGATNFSRLTTLGTGLLILLFAAAVPLIGWLTVAIAAAGGLGAALECLFGRR